MANNQVERDLRDILVAVTKLQGSQERVEDVLFNEIRPQVNATNGRLLVVEKKQATYEAEKRGKTEALATVTKKKKSGVVIWDYEIGGKEFMFLAVLISQVILLIFGT